MSSRDDPEKSYNVPLPDNNYVTVYLRDSMTNEEFLASACIRKNLNPMEHFVRVKKRREMEDHNYFVPHRNDLIETYVSDLRIWLNWFRKNINSISDSCTPTRSSKFALKSYIKLNCNVRLWSKCGAFRWRQNLLRTLTVKMNYVVMSVAWKTKASLCKTVRGENPV